jgi:hypothetical protein
LVIVILLVDQRHQVGPVPRVAQLLEWLALFSNTGRQTDFEILGHISVIISIEKQVRDFVKAVDLAEDLV